MKIRIDDREHDRIQKAYKHYTKDEIHVDHLEFGDFIFNDEVVFEYKKYQDFINSVIDKRVFNQAINQLETFKYHFVIIELPPDIDDDMRRRKQGELLPFFSYEKFYGSIARLNTYTTVILLEGGVDACLEMMKIQAEKCLDNKPLVKEISKKEENAAMNFLSSCIRGISYKRAEWIVSELNLHSLRDLLKLKYKDLVGVRGIGDNTAKRILKQIKGDRK